MAFNKSFLTAHGVPEDQVEAILAERSRTLTDYIPKADVQAQIDAAVAEAQKNTPPSKVEETEEYKALAAENAKIKAFQTDDFKGIKDKFREDVWGKLDHSKPLPEQLTAIKEQYPEFYAEETKPDETKPTPNVPTFGAPTTGTMPTGTGKTFGDYWGFNKSPTVKQGD